MCAREQAKKINERTSIARSISSCECVCVICRQFVRVCGTDARLSMRSGSLTIQFECKRNSIHTDTFIYSQTIFIFISNTSIDIFCSFRVIFPFFAALLLYRRPYYFYAIEISGIFFVLSSRLRLILFGINATNENQYECTKLYNVHYIDDTILSITHIHSFLFLLAIFFGISHQILFVKFSPHILSIACEQLLPLILVMATGISQIKRSTCCRMYRCIQQSEEKRGSQTIAK